MLKLGKLTDYAMTVMVQLTREGGSRSAPYLAEKTSVPEPTVSKVLKALAKSGLLESGRGVGGGYRLSRAATDISVGQVIEAMDGPIAIVACVEGADEPCGSEQRCPVKGKWTPLNNAIKDALHAVKLSDMAIPVCGEPAPQRVYQITAAGGQSHVSHD